MSDLVPAEDIEQIVGRARHATMHVGRAVSSKQVAAAKRELAAESNQETK